MSVHDLAQERRIFPSGRSIGSCRKDAKRLAKQDGIPLHQALNDTARANGIDLPWSRALALCKERA